MLPVEPNKKRTIMTARKAIWIQCQKRLLTCSTACRCPSTRGGLVLSVWLLSETSALRSHCADWGSLCLAFWSCAWPIPTEVPCAWPVPPCAWPVPLLQSRSSSKASWSSFRTSWRSGANPKREIKREGKSTATQEVILFTNPWRVPFAFSSWNSSNSVYLGNYHKVRQNVTHKWKSTAVGQHCFVINTPLDNLSAMSVIGLLPQSTSIWRLEWAGFKSEQKQLLHAREHSRIQDSGTHCSSPSWNPNDWLQLDAFLQASCAPCQLVPKWARSRATCKNARLLLNVLHTNADLLSPWLRRSSEYAPRSPPSYPVFQKAALW